MDGSVETLQLALHYGGHFLVPFVFAALIWRTEWKRAGAIMVAANLIDLDHLLASPIFDPDRCSVGFHLLHGWEAAAVFAAMLFIPKLSAKLWWTRVFGLGALWHLAVDYGDCQMMAL